MRFAFLSGISEDQSVFLSLMSPIIWQRSSCLQLPWVKIYRLLVLLILQALQTNPLQTEANGQSWALRALLCQQLCLTQPQIALSPFLQQQQLFSSVLPGSLGDSSLDICPSHLFSRHRGQTFPLYSCPVLLFWCSDEHTGEVGTNKNTRHGSYKDFLSHLRWARLTKINPLLLTGVPT